MSKPMEMSLVWSGDLRFEATSPSKQSMSLDGDAHDGASPMQALLASFAGCMSIDVIDILTKMRTKPDALELHIRGERNAEPPRSFTSIDLVFRVRGDVAKDKVERAIQLSFDKYCSVFHSLRKDLKVSHSLEISHQ